MSPFDIYVFILCFIVFASLTALFSFLIKWVIQLTVRLVRSGTEDERITTEYMQLQKNKQKKLPVIIDRVVSLILCCVLFAFLDFRCM